MRLTAVPEEAPAGYIGYVLELSGANTQGATLTEVKRNLREAIRRVSAANRRRNRPRRRTGMFREIWHRN